MDTLPTQKTANHDQAALESSALQIPSTSASSVVGFKSETLPRTVACRSAALSKSTRVDNSFLPRLLRPSQLRSSRDSARITIPHPSPKHTKAGTMIRSSGRVDRQGSRPSLERIGSTYYTSHHKSLATNRITTLVLILNCRLSQL